MPIGAKMYEQAQKEAPAEGVKLKKKKKNPKKKAQLKAK
jgi:hypothetical protein